MVNLAEAGANGMMISGPLMDLVSSYINSALAGFGVAGEVTTGEGTITIKVGAM
jgi:hypothetical protein